MPGTGWSLAVLKAAKHPQDRSTSMDDAWDSVLLFVKDLALPTPDIHWAMGPNSSSLASSLHKQTPRTLQTYPHFYVHIYVLMCFLVKKVVQQGFQARGPCLFSLYWFWVLLLPSWGPPASHGWFPFEKCCSFLPTFSLSVYHFSLSRSTSELTKGSGATNVCRSSVHLDLNCLSLR